MEDSDSNMDILAEVKFPEDVQQVLDEVFPSDDPLEQANFNVVDYINQIFPTEQSLSNIDDIVSQVQARIQDLDVEVKNAVRQQTTAGQVNYFLKQIKVILKFKMFFFLGENVSKVFVKRLTR